jgi:hypothetical protein
MSEIGMASMATVDETEMDGARFELGRFVRDGVIELVTSLLEPLFPVGRLSRRR